MKCSTHLGSTAGTHPETTLPTPPSVRRGPRRHPTPRHTRHRDPRNMRIRTLDTVSPSIETPPSHPLPLDSFSGLLSNPGDYTWLVSTPYRTLERTGVGQPRYLLSRTYPRRPVCVICTTGTRDVTDGPPHPFPFSRPQPVWGKSGTVVGKGRHALVYRSLNWRGSESK